MLTAAITGRVALDLAKSTYFAHTMDQHRGPLTRRRVLLLADTLERARSLREQLSSSGLETSIARDPVDVRRLSNAPGDPPWGLVLLALAAPTLEDLALVAELRCRGDDVPLMIVAKDGDVSLRVRALDLGTDDYIREPIDSSELCARIRAVMRRYSGPTIEVGSLRLELRRSIALFGAERIDLSPMEFDFLRALAERPGQCLSHRYLLDRVWGIGFDPGTNLVAVHVARLRRKLGKERQGMVRTVHGLGYRLDVGFAHRGERAG